MKNTPAEMIAAFVKRGGKITRGTTRKAFGWKTFNVKGPVANLGAKQVTMRDTLGYARR